MFCQECNQSQTICQDTTPTPCECPVKDLSTDCIVYTGDESTCSNIPKGVTLTEYLEQLDTFICQALEDINTGANLINVGTGIGIYKGIDLLGRRELKSLKSTDNSVTITTNEANTEIDLSVNVITPEICLISTDSSVTIEEEEGCFNLSAKTFIEAGDNVSISGSGTEVDPYVIQSTDTVIEVVNGTTTTVSGNGTTTPYSVEVLNLQKAITIADGGNYNLQSTDNFHTIFVTMSEADSTGSITIPAGLPNNFTVSFFLDAPSNATLNFVNGLDVTLNTLAGYDKNIKTNGNWAMIEKKLNTENYYLAGNITATP